MRGAYFRELLFLVLAAFTAWPDASAAFAGAQNAPKVTCEALSKQLQDKAAVTVLDVRSSVEFLRGHIAGALSAPVDSLRANPPWSKEAELVVYCSGIGCDIAETAATILRLKGYADVKTLRGGFWEWEQKGLPVAGDLSALIARRPAPPSGKAALGAPELAAADLSAELKAGRKLVLVDTRPPFEYAAGHLPGARNVPYESFDARKVLAASEIVVYDRFADRSRNIVRKLKDAGMSARALAGGVGVWAAAGYPLSIEPDHGN